MTLVTHVLLCEMQHGLVLVDAGIGTADVADPTGRLGRSARLTGAVLGAQEPAAVQLTALGYAPADVTDIVATHLDYNHIGGLADFPNAILHTTATEIAEATSTARNRKSRVRYRTAHIAQIESAKVYDQFDTTVLGLPACEVAGVEGIHLIPTPGHTQGHAAVAVQDSRRGWLVHAGDSFMHHAVTRPRGQESKSLSSNLFRGIERLTASDASRIRQNHSAMRELSLSGVRVFCSHDRSQFDALEREEAALALRS